MDFDIQVLLGGLARQGSAWVMWLLVGCSIVGLAVALERALTVYATRDGGEGLRSDVVRLLRAGDLAQAARRLASSRSFEARIVRAGVDAAPDGPAAVEERLQAATQTQRVHMERRLVFLGTLGANAPFVGLLGTVIGIIGAFHQLDASAGRVSAGLMGQVGEALVATAVGILVAIPAVVAYNFFQRVNRTRLLHAEALGRELLAMLRRSAS